ncbi:hypothetical protein N658DRAFT_517665 [Parathielavia hyrcaniae]|uniref:Uncharacterized protein n=1 Tax=Parathielavia hyrcaniae TaxID=113614 RepID=A0AAN6PYN5_9PEZI|nr:hypothetical protein N658DRAFT_517665 [Parathielavia hyrcaniae]
MALHMLMTASSLGYTPSTLSLMNTLLSQRPSSFSKTRARLRDVESRFKRLLRTENNPDAMTLQGRLILKEGGSSLEALNYFNRAIEAGRPKSSNPSSSSSNEPSPSSSSPRPRPPRWTFEGSCYLNRGSILLQQRKPDQAAAAFRVAALELGLAEGYVQLAKLLPPAEERETYLMSAAQAGHVEACRLLALDLARRASDASFPGGDGDRAYAVSMAREWVQIDPDVGQEDGVVAELEERVGKWWADKERHHPEEHRNTDRKPLHVNFGSKK